jgi:hypothetical protein
VRVLADTERLWRTDFLYEHWDNDDDPETSIPLAARLLELRPDWSPVGAFLDERAGAAVTE